MTLSAFVWNIVRTYTLTPGRRYSFGCRYRLGTASNLVMYVSAADNDYVGDTGTFLGTPLQGGWSTARLDFSVPGGIAKLHFGAFGGSIPGLVQQSAGTLDLYSTQIRASAFEGELVSVTLALTGSATLDGLTAQDNVGCCAESASAAVAAEEGTLWHRQNLLWQCGPDYAHQAAWPAGPVCSRAKPASAGIFAQHSVAAP